MEYRDSNNIYNERNGGCTGLIHTVQKGDTLYKIGKMHNVALSKIMEANPNVDIYNLQIGTRICVPVEGAILPRESSQEAPRQATPMMPPTNMNSRENTENNRGRNQYRQVNDNLNKLYRNKQSGKEQYVCPTCPPQRECPPERE